MIVVTWGSATDTGKVRARNEDSLLAESPVFVVADGMGGHQGGATASRIAVDTFRGILGRTEVSANDVALVIEAANQAILDRARSDPAVCDMGTTAVGLILFTEAGSDFWLAFNVGDSRLYRLCNGVLDQISVDHSYVQELVVAGHLDPEAARHHPDRSVITRVLGGRNIPVPDFWIFPPEPGERFLLCSDGLTGELEDDAVAELLGTDADPQAVAELLVRAADDAGGGDNITVVVVDVVDAAPSGLEVSTVDRPRPDDGAGTSRGHR